MHPDLPKLLDVQGKDHRLAESTSRIDALAAERAALDAALEAARNQIAALKRAAADAATRRSVRREPKNRGWSHGGTTRRKTQAATDGDFRPASIVGYGHIPL